jgi:hypothetical protein
MNLIKKFFVLVVVLFSFYSCQKEVIEIPDNTQQVPNEVDILPLILNKDWKIVEAYYVSPNVNKYQKHPFVSLITPQFGATTMMDTIIKDFTTWRFETKRFIVDGNVILDEVSSSDPKLSFNGDNIITLYFGFTNRNLEINKHRLINEGVLEIKGPLIGSLGGSDYNVIVLTDDGSYSDISSNVIPSNYLVDPNLIDGLPSSNISSNLYGQTWLLTDITSNGFTLPNTNFPYTIVFNNDGTYSVDGLSNTNRRYRVVGVPFYPLVDLELYDFSPMGGGNFVVKVSLTSLQDGVVYGSQMKNIYNLSEPNRLIYMNRQ